MAGDEPEKGDKVSWNWGGGAPGGTVAEKKTEGEIAIQSKKGNTIKKNASKDNPAVHISRSGNDVVKRASELNVDKKASGGGGGKRKHEDEEKKEEPEDEIKKNDEGKEVRAGGKKQKKDNKTEPKEAEKAKEAEDEKQEKEEKEDAKPKANEKKKAGRPKGGSTGASKTAKPHSKPRSTDGVSARTRSQKK